MPQEMPEQHRVSGRFPVVSRARHERARPLRALVLCSVLPILISGWTRAADGEKGSGEYCGLYCVYGALQSIGKEVPFETLLHPRYMSSWGGSSIGELRQAVIDAGAYAVALTGLGAEGLRSARHPMILHVASDGQLKRYNHWVVFCGMEDGKARLLDAPNPMQLVPLSDILARWDGTALVVSGEPSGVRSIEVGEGASHLSVILLSLLVVCLADYGLRRPRSAPGGQISHPSRSRVFGVLSQSIVLLCSSFAMGVGIHLTDDAGFLRSPSTARYVAAANISHFFPKLTYEEARRFLNERRGVVIDARYPDSFQQGHLAGAISVPMNASSTERRERLNGVPHGTPLLVYCQSRLCEYDESLATLLARDGFETISLYPGGWMEWEEHERLDRVQRQP